MRTQRITYHKSNASVSSVIRSRAMSSTACSVKHKGRGRPKGKGGCSIGVRDVSDKDMVVARKWKDRGSDLSRFEV